MLDEASDTILSEIINRNFIRCPVDSDLFIFRDNPEDNMRHPVIQSEKDQSGALSTATQSDLLNVIDSLDIAFTREKSRKIFNEYKGDL